MIYLKTFNLLDEDKEYWGVRGEERTIFNSYYPFGIFVDKEFERITFDNITIFYGGNGSGKTTLINIISEALRARRNSPFDKGSYFNNYVVRCEYDMFNEPLDIKMITSDDVFEYLLDIRSINRGVDRRKEQLSREYLDHKYREHDSFMQYEELKNSVEAKRSTMSKFVKRRLANNTIIEHSNGESALMFWEREINEDGLYLLDEPENSLSAENQLKLKQFIEDSARFYNCQFIISTHSPFLLNLLGAKIYDLDSIPVVSKKWNELPNVKVYYDFFKERKEEFEKES